MRTIILSFSPDWYPYLRSGDKIYEHRKRICAETVRAYIYLGNPYRQIVAVATLGDREKIEDWLEKYKYNAAALMRIKDCLTRNVYAKPICDFQEIKPIDIRLMEKEIDNFRVPISYMFIDDREDIFNYIKEREVANSRKIVHDFSKVDVDKICKC